MTFDRKRLLLLPLHNRIHDLDISVIKPLQENSLTYPSFKTIAANIKNAKKAGKSVIMMLGGHVIRSGVQRYIIDMIEKGYITCLAMNGSGVIHDLDRKSVV
jgi:deoxyhypusine synthase